MNARQFLKLGGLVLVIVGILGFIPGIIGPTPSQSIFGSTWYFDNYENGAHVVLGVVGILAGYYLPVIWQRYLAGLVAIIALFAGLFSIAGSAELLGANLENPLDTILHLVIGAWAAVAVIWNRERSGMGAERGVRRAA